jgi:predicted nucleotide-binding protein
MTPDDRVLPAGASSGSPFNYRARQNVILELGYFIGKLGRKNVCALKQGDVELPSDILGVVWIPLDEHGAWRQNLAKELQAAGHNIDWNQVMGT